MLPAWLQVKKHAFTLDLQKEKAEWLSLWVTRTPDPHTVHCPHTTHTDGALGALLLMPVNAR